MDIESQPSVSGVVSPYNVSESHTENVGEDMGNVTGRKVGDKSDNMEINLPPTHQPYPRAMRVRGGGDHVGRVH